ncbi:hypothetical protein [Slackia piriformis]|uniref:hypothetical protein n=1 Tax=Slackia piriformis TaxID=626934 RepID=UPI0026DAA52D|nr:hypothetical protein [Slackia piriformis]MDO5023460.1 hypothetical protein [Slackia piriformis]
MTAQQPISPPPDFSSISYRPPNGTKFNTPFIMAIAALVLSIMGGVVSALGIACAVAALVVRKKSHAPVKEHRAPRATLALSILAVVFGISMVFSSLQPASITVNVSTSDQGFSQSPITIVMDGTTDEGESVHEKLEVTPGMPLQLKDKEPGTYSFTVDTASLDGENFSYKESGTGPYEFEKGQDLLVNIELTASPFDGALVIKVDAPDWKNEYGKIPVNIEGTTTEGESVSKSVSIEPGNEKRLENYDRGTYSFSVDESVLTQDSVIFKVDGPTSCEFDKKSDAVAIIRISIDEQATAEAQKKAEEEAQQAAEEAMAQQAQEEAAAQAASADAITVYGTETGSKYHRENCSSLKKSKIPMTLDEAKNSGLGPCSKCNPPA